MTYEVVVVGGGIGGLTVAALLAARGVSVCLLERSPEVGGCAANFEKLGYSFEPGAGLYAGWQPNEIHDRVFKELPVDPPAVRELNPSYVVRLPDRTEIALTNDKNEFEQALRSAFPECAEGAVKFYQEIESLSKSLRRALVKVPDLRTAGPARSLSGFLPNFAAASTAAKLASHTAIQHLDQTSVRFKRFIDAQLQMFTQSASDDCSYLSAAVVLDSARSSLFSMQGGAATLANVLADSIRKSGGKIRLDSPVLRLAFAATADGNERVTGVDLLSGETVQATKAVVSNLTVWDTYGKLFGLSRTPAEVRKQLNALNGAGAYLLFASLEEAAAARLPAEHMLALFDEAEQEQSQLLMSLAPAWDTRAPAGKRAVTIQTLTDVNDWFTFHEDETDHETKDQAMLEDCWRRLHTALPELGSDIEVIDSATPRTQYDQTRRKLGMSGGLAALSNPLAARLLNHRTHVRNVYRVGDTVFPGVGISGVTHSALAVTADLTK